MGPLLVFIALVSPLHYLSETAFCDSSGCSLLHAILSTNEKDLDNDFCWAGHPVCLFHKVARMISVSFLTQEEVLSEAKELITLQHTFVGFRVEQWVSNTRMLVCTSFLLLLTSQWFYITLIFIQWTPPAAASVVKTISANSIDTQ